MPHPVVHFEIAGADGEKLAQFYRDLFEWEIDSVGGGYRLIGPEPPGIGGGLMQTYDDMPSYVTIYVSVDDLEASLQKAAELGGQTVVSPRDIPGVGWFAMFRDPEGNLIGLFKT